MEQLSKYIENENFILWVFEPNEQLEGWWRQFETDNPEEKRNIQLARRVLLKFRTTKNVLTETEKIRLFSKVLRRVEEKKYSGKTENRAISLVKYAAVAFLFFAVGALVFYKQNQFNPQFLTDKLAQPIPETVAKLIRANGEDILLKESNSVVKYQQDGRLVVNKDTLMYGSDINHDLAMNQLIIPFGKTSEVLLSDGTRVFLNAGSRLVYPEHFSGETREVYLVGEAFFDVKSDHNYPFIVQLDDLRIKVTGTRFNVSAYSSDNIIETVLEEGRVNLQKNNAGLFEKVTELMPDQMASFNKITRETDLKSVNAETYILWTRGLLQFESTDLSRITKRLERYYNIRFEFSDPMLGGLRISGKLELKEDTDEICERIARTASVKIIKKSNFLYEIIK